MSPDEFQQAWKSAAAPTRVEIDPNLLLQEVKRNQSQFEATIFLRDLREVVVAITMVPVWLYLGVHWSLPWTWYLGIPAFVWIAAFMTVDRRRQKRKLPEPGESLREQVEHSLAQVAHQISLLKNVFWWYILPIDVAVLAFCVHSAWRTRIAGWGVAVTSGMFTLTVVVAVSVFVYWLNQKAVRVSLEPRRRELEKLFLNLGDETGS